MPPATTHPDQSRRRSRLPGAGLSPTMRRGAAVAAGALVAAVAHLLALALGAEMLVPAFDGEGTQQIATIGVAASAAVAGLLGWAAAWAASRFSGRPRRSWQTFALIGLIASFGPVIAIEATALTQLVLGVQHLLVAAIVIPVFVHTLPERA